MSDTVTRQNAGALLAQFAVTQVGKGYSEQSPAGSDGDGHLWVPGEPYPNVYDCSGLVHTAGTLYGLAISPGNAQSQWTQHLGGVVVPSQPLVPGDIGSFMGSDNVPGYAGHTGIVISYNAKTRTGIMVNAADPQQGVCESMFIRGQATNVNGLGVIGFYRPANSVPVPTPAPSPAQLAAHGYVRLLNPAQAHTAQANGWQLLVWNGIGFSNSPANLPKGTPEYASARWRTKNPNPAV